MQIDGTALPLDDVGRLIMALRHTLPQIADQVAESAISAATFAGAARQPTVLRTTAAVLLLSQIHRVVELLLLVHFLAFLHVTQLLQRILDLAAGLKDILLAFGEFDFRYMGYLNLLIVLLLTWIIVFLSTLLTLMSPAQPSPGAKALIRHQAPVVILVYATLTLVVIFAIIL